MNATEGFIDVSGGKVWYQKIGEKGAPLVVVHGGPGYPHDYLEPLGDLADEHTVIFYDQLGCGNSERPANRALWTVNGFTQELQTVITALKLDTYFVLGQSWGATLAVSHALNKPKGLKGIILANPYISSPHWEKDAARLIRKLSWRDRWALWRSKVGTTAFEVAKQHYYDRFVYGMKDLPEPCNRSGEKMNTGMYRYMWGPTEFIITGTLKNFNLVPRLNEISLPTLFLCGRYDEATPEACGYFASLMQNAKVKILENSAHHAHWTQRQEYLAIVREFIGAQLYS